ncbi:tRNA lysidine(34) synthetase TilS [Loktanella sp. R86503]|uniref:tRNA lysidine(34) synthetase TilS n=1 Tax=Loktanella sp. R86503 TaxID=3093847 RepID=UPI0036D986E1
MSVNTGDPLQTGLPQRFADRMGQLLGPDFPQRLCLAVSGGGDSMAMLHLAAGWARVYGIALRVATVDHGLRDASVDEAAMVAAEAQGLGLPHDTLRWQGWDGRGNLQNEARHARRMLLHDAADGAPVLMAHTQNDQAETVLMRLARGSGVDGLAGMSDDVTANGMRILRPLLTETRAALRHYVTTLKIPFVDDPSNDDADFARVRMRAIIGQEGLNTATLAATATHMARARQALDVLAQAALGNLSRTDPTAPGAVVWDRDEFGRLAADTQLRVAAAAVMAVTAATYRPRLEPLSEAVHRALSGGAAVLAGAIIVPHRDQLYVAREPKAVAGLCDIAGPSCHWDTGWRLEGPDINGLTVRALGESGLALIADKPKPRAPRHVLAGLPAVWDDTRLVAFAPLNFGVRHRLIPPGNGEELTLARLAH